MMSLFYFLTWNLKTNEYLGCFLTDSSMLAKYSPFNLISASLLESKIAPAASISSIFLILYYSLLYQDERPGFCIFLTFLQVN